MTNETKPQRTMLAERIFSGTWADLYRAEPDMTIEDCNSYLDSLTKDAPGSSKKFSRIIERRNKLVLDGEYEYFCGNLNTMRSVLPYTSDGVISDYDADSLFHIVAGKVLQLFDGTKAEREKLKKIFKNVKKRKALVNQENLYNQLFFGEENHEERHSET